MPRALVLGATGLIGRACAEALRAAGWEVRGAARSAAAGRRRAPWADWVELDLATAAEADWRAALLGVDAVVNAAGALQDGPREDLEGVHVRAVEGLVAAAPPALRVVQISATGVREDARTSFMQTKARGDAALRASRLGWVILRPALVLAPEAWGGTALLRAAASVPLVAPQVMPGAMIRTVWIGDVAEAAVRAAEGAIPAGTTLTLAEGEARSLPETTAALREWLGRGRGLPVAVPGWALRVVGAAGDALGRLGWRAPFRTTALKVLEEGVDEAPQIPTRPLPETLALMAPSMQERWFGRLMLMLPLIVGTLSLFWLVSGLIGAARLDAAAAILTSRGSPDWLARAFVLGGAAIDIALGAAILWRPFAARAALGMAAVCAAYLAGTALAPGIWLDPLGPYVKILPALALSLVAAALLEER